MRKLIAAINMTLDGFCDHTLIPADDELHEHYARLLDGAGALLYGRTTYQLMEFWHDLAANPSGDKSMDDFALVMDKTPKIVFSHTLEQVDWESARLADQDLESTVLELRQQGGHDIFVGSRSLILQLMELQLIDEYQICVHPVLAGQGLPLFYMNHNGITFKLLKTKIFRSGAVVLYYETQNSI